MPQRTEPRVSKEASIRIFGMDSQGRPVNIAATTVDVSKHGARLTGVKAWDYPGETIGIRYGTEKARYRIMWVGLPGTPVEGQIGLMCVESGKYIWDVTPPTTASTSMDSHSILASMSMPPRPSAHQLGVASTTQRYADRRRKDQRFAVSGSANIREVGKNVPQWTTLHDLSNGGCYVETTAPLPEHARVDVTIQVGEIKIDARGTVTVKHPLVGMGIKFTEMSPLNRDRLRHLISAIDRGDYATPSGGH